MAQAQLKLSDAMWETAHAIVSMAKKAGIVVDITELYQGENAKTTALIAAMMRGAIERVNKIPQIEVVKD